MKPITKGIRSATNEANADVDLAIVELFAGLRATHAAARKVKGLKIVLAQSAGKCASANVLASKSKIAKTLFEDVRSLDDKWATSVVEEAKKKKAPAKIIIAGFPCKGLETEGPVQAKLI